MKNNKRLFMIPFILVAVLLFGGCSATSSSEEEEKVENVNTKFLLFTEEYINENGESIGDLYITSEGAEPEKISGEVLSGNFVYYNNKDQVYFLNSEHELYEFTPGQDKLKLAEGVTVFDGSGETVSYQNEEMDLYIIRDENNEKIASDVSHYIFIGDNLHYLDSDGDYTVYHIAERQETEMASDVYYFEVLNNKGDVAYLNDDSMLYYKENGKESVRISNDEASFIGLIDDKMMYLSGDDNDLYTTEIKGNKETKKIASEVITVEYEGGDFYYINSDNNLFRIGEKEEKATKLASDVSSFTLDGKNIFVIDDEQNIFKLSGEEKAKVASSVNQFDITPEGKVIYTNDENELFVGNTKISSDINYYTYYHGTVAYSTKEDKIFLMDKDQKEEVVLENAKAYSTAYYHNQLIYTNELSFEDIAGVWKFQDDEETFYIEIKKDGVFTELLGGESIQVEIVLAAFNSLDVMMDGESLTITKNVDDTLSFDDGIDELHLTKSTKEEAENYALDIQLQEEMGQLESLVSDYLYEVVYAINYGDPTSLSNYIHTSSVFHDEQSNYVVDAYNNGIYEELLNYNVTDIRNIKDGVYEVVVQEEYNVVDFEGNEKYVSYESTYTIERVDGGLYITGMKINNDASAA